MSPRKRVNMRIALPPRVNLSLGQSSDSPMSTPAPHTPNPYSFAASPQIAFHSLPGPNDEGDTDTEDEPVAGQKRAREAEEVEVEWTVEEEEQIRSTLIHPFRPIIHVYPPGELPPAEALDDLASQIVQHAFRSAPNSHRSTPTAQLGSKYPREGGWRHGWDATRKKLFDVALAESNFGKDDKERRMPRAERKAQRPGLKRVDSMDFLDQEEDNSEHIGRALRLSTTLQNTAKADPLLVALSRTPSGGSTGLSDPMTKLSASTPPLHAASITLTPPSPIPESAFVDSPESIGGSSLSPTIPTPLPIPSAPPMRRRVSSRSSMPRPQRPSLLQRGRSFTASDLQAESAAASAAAAVAEGGSGRGTPSPIKEHPLSMPSTASPGGSSAPSTTVKSPPSPSPLDAFHPILKARIPEPPKLTRSLSSIAVGASHPAHSMRDTFLAHPPSITKAPGMLAQPVQIGVGLGIKNVKATGGGDVGGGGWSDSEDESAPSKARGKKMKGRAGSGRKIAGQKRLELAIGATLPHLSALAGVEGDGLRSPFEERDAIQL